jgi:hypothetical protein
MHAALVVVSEMMVASWSFCALFASRDVSCCHRVGLTVFCVDLAGASALKLYYILRQIIFSMWKTLENDAEHWDSLLADFLQLFYDP